MAKDGIFFKWVKTPAALQQAISRLEKKTLVACHAVCVYVGQMMADEAQQDALWEDRTGNARSGLTFAVDGFGLQPVSGEVSPGAAAQMLDTMEVTGSPVELVLALGHTVYYGIYLELDHGQQYAIIIPTMTANIPVLESMLAGIWK